MNTDTSSLDRQALWPAMVDSAYVRELQAFAHEHIAPHAEHIDKNDVYPVDILKEMARRGYNTVTLPVQYGGQGLSYPHAAAVFEEMAAASAAVGISLITIYQAQNMITLFGQESLKQRYLPAFAQGLLSSYALTEASHGSDIRKLDTKAQRHGNEWVIQGEKHFITSATAAELFIILAETDVGVSVFAIPRNTPGLSMYEGPNSATFGLRNGPHMNVRLDAVRVPADHLIGQEGKGVRQAVTVLNYSRTLAAAISLGIARAAFEGALVFARDRIAFDQRVLNFQGIQWYFADMLADIDAARLLTYHAARALDTDDQIARWGSEAKLKASAVATQVASQSAQICGAYGIMENAPFGRYLRDAKAYEIAGGSSEILKNTLGKALMPMAGITRDAKVGA
jgi:alkylation response protein AidB-like acyl-CoA dehydrogenase